MMDENAVAQLIGRSGASYWAQGQNTLQKTFRTLLHNKKIPQDGWTEENIYLFLHSLAASDTNNTSTCVGMGEREGRVVSQTVRQKHFGFAHGIGRSGNLTAIQPKSPGGSVLNLLSNHLVLHALHIAGLLAFGNAIVIPCATGLSMSMCLTAIRRRELNVYFKNINNQAGETEKENRDIFECNGENRFAKQNYISTNSLLVAQNCLDKKIYVLTSRIDQKSCYKAVVAAGLTPVIIPLRRKGDALETDLDKLLGTIKWLGAPAVCAVLSTTSTFAPRLPDDIRKIAQICATHGVAHLINNAYGVQCSKITHNVDLACREGRVDCVVQSLDKNFQVPVGGAVIAGPDKAFIDFVGHQYPGRASLMPSLDFFITIMSLGMKGWKKQLKDRRENFVFLKETLSAVLLPFAGYKILDSADNRISLAVTIPHPHDAEQLGPQLFYRRCSGCRVVKSSQEANEFEHRASFEEKGADFEKGEPVRICHLHENIKIEEYLPCYGAHTDLNRFSYFTVACAIGAERKELRLFLERLTSILDALSKCRPPS